MFRNPDKTALAWEHQRSDRARFVEFFDTDLLVVSGEQTQDRLDGYYTYCRDAVLGPDPKDVPPVVSMSLPPDLTDAETVALIYDERDGLGFYPEFGLVEEAFANPDLLRRRRWREQTLSYLEDDSVEPMVLRRLAARDLEKASVVFRRLLKRPRFDWSRDGEALLREVKPEYFDRSPRPRVSPLNERLAQFARRR
ncbi:hypothetical protein [Actinoplanes sichuanensis]|uniref:Uncharacterized protein n=1 Tax=Actinoplanes sichuanensis TaxID=512349 RepID=A0ABW4A8D1_9ACTN|nr:hypothetical protein [Actinoplanes sichuanensis]